jgi:hypothetical protein
MVVEGLNFKTYRDGVLVGNTNITVDISPYTDINKITLNATAPDAFEINDFRLYDNILSIKDIKEIARGKILHYTFNDLQEPTTNLVANPIPLSG